ncbi:hypothetical protein [Acinetobacter pragensis]|nr:hypothetical protein [Acinetobacter pragensis]
MNNQNSNEMQMPYWTALKFIAGSSILYCGLMVLFAHAFYSTI